jgi:hypothetical protein
MSVLTESLDRIWIWLQNNKAPDLLFLQQGLSEAEIEEIIADLPLQLPEDIQELYKWKNGTKIIGDYLEFSCIFEKWSFYPLQIVANGYRHKVERFKIDIFEPFFEHQNLNILSIFFSSDLEETGYVVIDDKIQQCSPVIFQHCKGGVCVPITKYASLTSLFVTIAECCENAYYVDADGNLNLDNEAALDIWRKYNVFD